MAANQQTLPTDDIREFKTLINKVAPGVPGCPYPVIIQRVRDTAIDLCARSLVWRHVVRQFKLEAGRAEYLFEELNCDDFYVYIKDPTLKATSPAAYEDENGNLIVDSDGLYTVDDENRYHSIKEITIGDDGDASFQATEGYAITYLDFIKADVFAVISAAIADDDGEFKQLNRRPNECFFRNDSGWPVTAQGTPQYITTVTPGKFCLSPAPDKDYTVSFVVALVPRRDAVGMSKKIFNIVEDILVHGTLKELMTQPSKQWFNDKLAGYHAKEYSYLLNLLRADTNLTAQRSTLVARMRCS